MAVLWGASHLDTSVRNMWVLQAALGGGLATHEAVLAAALGGSGKDKAHSLENSKGNLPVILAQ